MKTAPIWNVGPHAYRLDIVDGQLELWYCLNHAEGYPRGNNWTRSSRRWPATTQGAQQAVLYADHLLREQEKEND